MSTLDAVLRLLPALLVLLGVLWAARRFGRRAGGGSLGMQVLERTMLSRGSQLVAVKVEGRVLLLGVTDRAVSLLGELPPGTDLDAQGGALAAMTGAGTIDGADLSRLTGDDGRPRTDRDAETDRARLRPASESRPWTGLISRLRWATSRVTPAERELSRAGVPAALSAQLDRWPQLAPPDPATAGHGAAARLIRSRGQPARDLLVHGGG